MLLLAGQRIILLAAKYAYDASRVKLRFLNVEFHPKKLISLSRFSDPRK